MTASETIGAIGVTLLLLAYLLNVMKMIRADKLGYASLNFVGASLACYSSWLITFIPFVILEGVWAVVSLISVVKGLLALKTGKL